jgi:hypothetical protein
MRAEKSAVGLLNNVECWRTRAKETRLVADTLHDGPARDALLQIANDWEQMAQLVEEGEENIAAEAGVTLVATSSGADEDASPNA